VFELAASSAAHRMVLENRKAKEIPRRFLYPIDGNNVSFVSLMKKILETQVP